MDILVIIMGIIVVIAGVGGFVMEHNGKCDNEAERETASDTEKNMK